MVRFETYGIGVGGVFNLLEICICNNEMNFECLKHFIRTSYHRHLN